MLSRLTILSFSPNSQSSVGNSIKDELMELVAGSFLSTSSSKRSLVNELLIKLEALNPTPSPAYSPLLNGAWEFLFTGGISPGLLGKCVSQRRQLVEKNKIAWRETGRNAMFIMYGMEMPLSYLSPAFVDYNGRSSACFSSF